MRGRKPQMTLAPGRTEGGPDNRHRGSDQWLYTIGGRGMVILNGKRHPLAAGTLVLIEQGSTHEIRNLGQTPLKTLNFYVRPAYTPPGETLPRGKP